MSRVISLAVILSAACAFTSAAAFESSTDWGTVSTPNATCSAPSGTSCSATLTVTAPSTNTCLWMYSLQTEVALSQAGQGASGYTRLTCPVSTANKPVTVGVSLGPQSYSFVLADSNAGTPTPQVAAANTTANGSQIFLQGIATGKNGTASTAANKYTRGVYAVWPTTTTQTEPVPPGSSIPVNPLSTDLLSNQGIVGLVLVEPWFAVEPAEGSYDWSRLDSLVEQASQNKLKVTLVVTDSQASAPSWILDKVQSLAPSDMISDYDPSTVGWRHCRNTVGPVFWDPTYHQARLALIAMLGARYTANKTVVGVGAQFADWYTDDWVMPSQTASAQAAICGNVHLIGSKQYDPNAGPAYVDERTAWYAAAGTTNGQTGKTNFLNLMTQTGEAILDATAQAFPNQAIKLPVKLSPIDTKATILTNVVNYGNAATWHKRFYLQTNGFTDSTVAFDPSVLTATVNQQNYYLRLIVQQCPHCGLQENAPYASGSGVNTAQVISGLQSISNAGLTYQPVYFEFFQQDATFVAAQPTFQTLTENMGTALRP